MTTLPFIILFHLPVFLLLPYSPTVYPLLEAFEGLNNSINTWFFIGEDGPLIF